MKTIIQLPLRHSPSILSMEKEIPTFLGEKDFVVIKEAMYQVLWSAWNTDDNSAYVRLKPTSATPEEWAELKADGWK